MLIFLTDIKKEELNQELLVKLEQASDVAQIDFVITSGFRPGDANGIDHGIKNGPHMSHKAVDIRCRDSVTRYKMIYGAMRAGFKRGGHNSIHIHLDCDETKPQNVWWIEPEPIV